MDKENKCEKCKGGNNCGKCEKMNCDTSKCEVVCGPMSQKPDANTEKIILKDLLIPISIVIAGALVAAGLYFGGSPIAKKEVSATDKVQKVTAEDNIRGSVKAKVKIVEYSDFDCPFCERFHNTMKEIVSKYSPDEVAWVYRHSPIPQLHPNAFSVAVASECVAEIGGNDSFWEFTDSYMEARGAGNTTVHSELIPQLVTEMGIDQDSFSECFDSGRHDEKINNDAKNASETGGGGTPWSIVIGPKGKTYPINGALPTANVEQLIQLALDEG